jgi:SAM-dependent methyltransferase
VRRALARLFGIAPPSPPPAAAEAAKGPDYKNAWNQAALVNAVDAILTGAESEAFERAGRGDADKVGRYLPADAAVLDIGCGIGRVERYLAPRVRELWAVDVSGEMIQRAGERLACFANMHLREVGNREYLAAFPDGRFDLVFSFLVLQHLEKEDAFLYVRDAFRVLRAGGIFLTQFPNLLSSAYSRAFTEGAAVTDRSPGRVRASTEPEVRHTLGLAGFEIADLWYGGQTETDSEIYVAARKPGSA